MWVLRPELLIIGSCASVHPRRTRQYVPAARRRLAWLASCREVLSIEFEFDLERTDMRFDSTISH